ncbi:MAG: hypothetical protein GY874_00495 [Desulfobacteraceae bacterium]|nr:hypothetical protein [Desulfobacteraceae bacterium]
MIIQIYEIQTLEEAQMMVRLGADHIGSVLERIDDWQNPEIKRTIQFIQSKGHKSSLIPLFTDIDTIFRALDYYQPNILHFCETLPAQELQGPVLELIYDRQNKIRQHSPGLQIMRSIPIAVSDCLTPVASLEIGRIFEPISDWFLTDTLLTDSFDQAQPVNGYVGITGKTCDWGVAKELAAASSIPVILAGGIGPSNAYKAVKAVEPTGIDSCTNTNRVNEHGKPVRFKKDPEKVKNMISAAHIAHSELNPEKGPIELKEIKDVRKW